MNKIYLAFLVLATISCMKDNQETNPTGTYGFEPLSMNIDTLKYPETKKVDVVDTYFGTNVPDPYRWLEDDLSEETADWVENQNKVTQQYMQQIDFQAALRARLEKVYNYEKVSSPFIEGAYTYYYKNDGLQNQAVLYRKKGGEENEEIFLNPNTFSKDGTTSLAGVYFSKDASKVAYLVSEGGSDWRKVIVMDANSKKIVEDTLQHVKFSGISWKGNEGFYYSSYEKPTGSELSAKTDQHIVYYHALGTTQQDDTIIFGAKPAEKHRYITASVTEDGSYLMLYAAQSTSGNRLFVKDLAKDEDFKVAMPNLESDCYVLDNLGSKLLLVTNYNAPNKRIVSVDAANPSYTNWEDLIPETAHVLNASKGGGFIFAQYMVDALSKVEKYDYSGKKIRDITLPGKGTVGGFSGKKDAKTIYFYFTNYATPTSIYEYNMESGTSELYRKPSIDFDPSQYISKQVFYTSKDGTKVPMMITHKKGLALDGTNPTYLYSYGGFNISLQPSFNPLMTVWLEQGGIYAVPNIRGGGEYGKDWHVAGTKMQKQNVFDDFIAAAEYLIQEKYTSSEKLAISGRSNGGLLVGATMTQRPELAKVALPGVGVLDMLRYHTFTAGAGWAYDYGTAQESKEMFEYLLGYSPLHNLKKTSYPATMVFTADHDDRVVPAHSFKFISELQTKHAGESPVLIRIETKSGHGAGKPTSKILDEWADLFGFTMYNLGVQPTYEVQN